MIPDFLHIGAPRAASTWLFENLAQHPGIWVPPHKNILYFHPLFQRYRLRKLRLYWNEIWGSKNAAQRRWNIRHFLTPFPGDDWYKAQFPYDPALVKGECAEAYCSLEEKDVARIAAMMPDVKIIFVLRDPVERLVSHAKHDLVTRKKLDPKTIPAEAYFKIVKHPAQIARSTYMKTIDLWEKYFPREQFLVLFFEDINENPQVVLQKICAFLGVDYKPDYFPSSKTGEKVNASTKTPAPPEVYDFAKAALKDDITALAARYGGAAERWKRPLEE
ncbi:MAG: sulfotransferase [Alphaproteobacteria bacterium]|nr:sulfotransferase [Alphaproteobacteria bacterium]MCD8570406.1 sulfotransferase [Alphaproteobacteria bacterium]